MAVSERSGTRTGPAGDARSAGSAAAGAGTGLDSRAATLALPVAAMLICVALPAYFNLGPLRLSPARLLLLAMIAPAAIRWMKLRKSPVDALVLGYCAWTALSMLKVQGVAQSWQFVGISFVEAFASYLIGRAYIRSSLDFAAFTRFFFWLIVVFTPMAAAEAVAGIRALNQLFSPVFSTFWWTATSYEKRLGMFRAQVGFEHPILWGVFAASGFALFWFSRRQSGRIAGPARAWVSALATFFSLSMGGMINVILQSGLIGYDILLRQVARRWTLMLVLVALGYVVVDLISNRNPFEVATTYLVFDSYTAYYRILIFQFGMDNVLANPVFGIGLNDWERPSWMPPSVDNFWLLTAMRSGIPAFLCIFAAFVVAVVMNGRRTILDPVAADQRKALNFVLVGLAIAISTVHIWGGVYYHVMFLLGAAGWVQSHQDGAAAEPAPSLAERRRAAGRTSRGAAERETGAPAPAPAPLTPRPSRERGADPARPPRRALPYSRGTPSGGTPGRGTSDRGTSDRGTSDRGTPDREPPEGRPPGGGSPGGPGRGARRPRS